MTITNKQRKVLFDKINTLSSTEHEEIFKIVRNHGISFSQNKNGVFFNLSNVSEDIIEEMENFISYCMNNKQELDEYDKIINECKMSNHLKMPVNTSLSKMGRMDTDINVKKQTGVIPMTSTWNTIKVNEVTMDKFIKFVEKINHDKDKICKKKVNVKFNNAKKRYSKKLSERKVENEYPDVLKEDSCIIIHT